MNERSLPKGVYQSGKKYVSKISYKGKVIHIGTFTTIDLAEQAYKDKQIELGIKSYNTISRVAGSSNSLSDAFTYDTNTGFLSNNKTGYIYDTPNTNTGYIAVTFKGKQYMAHRVIWELLNGPIPEGLVIDHINMDRADNKITNLRLATKSQNNMNSEGHGGKYPRGVTLRTSGRFQASIQKDGVKMTIGTYDTIEEASKMYKLKALELYGEFILNE